MDRLSYTGSCARVLSVTHEADGIKTLRIELTEGLDAPVEAFRPGQFVELTVLGVGEAPFSVSGLSRADRWLELTVARVGEVTERVHELEVGETVVLRGPYGRGFPLERLVGKDVLIVAGGIGLAPLRPFVHMFLGGDLAVRSLTVLYGARNPALVCFREELSSWASTGLIDVRTTVDSGTPGWTGATGSVVDLLSEARAGAGRGVALVCGPEVMMRIASARLLAGGWSAEDVFLSVERRMECGLGKCGHCGIGGLLVCQDGPVMPLSQLARWPEWQ